MANRLRSTSLVMLSSMALLVTSCKTLEENPVLSTIVAGGATYAGCKALGESDTTCLVAGAAVGAVTYAYLQSQLNEIKEIENVEAAPCKASDESRQAYCVTMDSKAVNFQSGKASISPHSMSTLKQVAGVIRQTPQTLVYIEGHTDSDGSEAFNQVLSEKRAVSVQNVFHREGIELDRMQALGYGESLPKDVTNKALNRRVEIRVEGEEG